MENFVSLQALRWKRLKTTILSLFLLVCIPTMLGADVTISPQEPVPPKKVETSTGIYDVKSKDDLLNFTTEEIRTLVKMEDNRTKGAGKTPHPILVYCFEERSFQYTGGKFRVDGEFGWFPAGLVELRISRLQNVLHFAEYWFGRADQTLELFLRHLEDLLDPVYNILRKKISKSN
jgi:hypothetical protein